MIISVRVGKNQKMTIGNNVKSPQTKKHTKKLLHVHVRVHVQYNVIMHIIKNFHMKVKNYTYYCTCTVRVVVPS